MEKSVEKKVALKMLEAKGYGILDKEPKGCDIVIEDEEYLAFVWVGEDIPTRKRCEETACYWLAEHDPKNCQVRFDHVGAKEVGENRFFTRHTKNFLEGFEELMGDF